jgi:hypothetical protein
MEEEVEEKPGAIRNKGYISLQVRMCLVPYALHYTTKQYTQPYATQAYKCTVHCPRHLRFRVLII